jgi:hypothetical protein
VAPGHGHARARGEPRALGMNQYHAGLIRVSAAHTVPRKKVSTALLELAGGTGGAGGGGAGGVAVPRPRIIDIKREIGYSIDTGLAR